jgi:uncharacterized protein YbaR (Trm112 family)
MGVAAVIRKELLECLLCPATRTRLTQADGSLVARVNEAIAAGRLRNVAGQTVERPLEEGLLREDGAVLYPIRDGIPILLVDEGIPLVQLKE